MVLSLAAFLGSVVPAASAAPAPKPHIFVYFADDAGWNDFGFTRGLLAPDASYTGPQSKTPQIDALARQGIILKSSYAFVARPHPAHPALSPSLRFRTLDTSHVSCWQPLDPHTITACCSGGAGCDALTALLAAGRGPWMSYVYN